MSVLAERDDTRDIGRFEPTPQELVMTLLGAYVRPRRSRPVWAGGIVRLLGELGFSDGAARIALTRLARRELLSRRKQGRHVHYTLTERACAVLAAGDRRIFTLGSGTGSDTGSGGAGEWTLLWHSIPDSDRRAREALVRRLRFLGFGSIQDGTWLAPRDIENEVAKLLDELGIRRHAGLLRGMPVGQGDVRAFVAKAWDIDALDRRYAAFVADFSGATAGDDRSAFALLTRLVHTFRQFPFYDPELPAELVDAPSHRAAAVALFHDLHAKLGPAAQRHFDEVTTP